MKNGVLNVLALIGLWVLGLSAPGVIAAETEASEQIVSDQSVSENIKQRVGQSQAALNLTEAQQAELRPILKASFSKQRAILDKYGLTQRNPDETGAKIGWLEARKLGQELAVLRRDTRSQIKHILNEDQLKEWDKMQKEVRARGRAWIQSRIKGNS